MLRARRGTGPGWRAFGSVGRAALARSGAWRRVRLVPVLVLVMGLSVACGERKGGRDLAARVNSDEITQVQVDSVLQQRGLRPDADDAPARQVLERLIDQQLAARLAESQKLDRDARVQAQLELVRREVLARAYVESVAARLPAPTEADVAQYYREHPALFAERRVFNLQEFQIEAAADVLPGLRSRLAAGINLNEFIEFLRAGNIKYTTNQGRRLPEQLLAATLEPLMRMHEGQAFANTTPNGMNVVVLLNTQPAPLSEEQARPAIEQAIRAERSRKAMEEEIQAQRAKASVEYYGRFSPPLPGSAAASGPAPGSVPAASAISPSAPASVPPR